MTNYAIVEKEGHLIQENEDKLLCIFSTRKDAEKYLKFASRPASELVILECEVKRLRKK